MGLYGALQASVSGMSAQSNKLSAISQNISNSDTTGYKDVEAQFENLISSANQNTFNGAGVSTNYSYLNSVQGSFTTTSTNTNLAVNGNGFFIVQNSAGQDFLTRDGSFTPDSNGNLVNDAGYTLLGVASGSTTSDANSLSDLVPVNVNGPASSQTPSTAGTLSANVPSTATAVTGDTPYDNTASSTYTESTSLVTYDNLGAPVTLDIYMTKTSDNTWELDVYNHADAASGGGFPYSSSALTSQTINFDPTTGDVSSVDVNPATTPATVTPASAVPISIPNGSTFDLDISGMTQNASDFSISAAHANGSPPSSATGTVSISADGTVSAVYADGSLKSIYQIQLASVPDPDALTPVSGNVWAITNSAGTLTRGAPGSSGFGTLDASSLESSTVDLATELTNMISAQSGYEANSKVFQTGSSLLEELVNLIK